MCAFGEVRDPGHCATASVDFFLKIAGRPVEPPTLADGVERPLCRIANSAVEVPATAIAVHSGKSLWSTLAIVAMVFQLRVVAVTP